MIKSSGDKGFDKGFDKGQHLTSKMSKLQTQAVARRCPGLTSSCAFGAFRSKSPGAVWRFAAISKTPVVCPA